MPQSQQDAVRMMQRVSETSLAMSHIVCSASRQTWTRPKLPLKTAAADKTCRLPKHCCVRVLSTGLQLPVTRTTNDTTVRHVMLISCSTILTLNSKIRISMNCKLRMHFFLTVIFEPFINQYGRRLVPRVKMLFKLLVAAFKWLQVYSSSILKINSFMRRTARTVETVETRQDRTHQKQIQSNQNK